ncbi:MAG: alanine--glyoxylate aminotransferase family protein [Actinobacteria bacterium]|nr:MAG: alanine--glyoxylate aminotransferase family protein [Actinomycetota bacterium]
MARTSGRSTSVVSSGSKPCTRPSPRCSCWLPRGRARWSPSSRTSASPATTSSSSRPDTSASASRRSPRPGAAGSSGTWGCRVERLAYEWGESPSPDDLGETLDRIGAAKVVFLTHSETSTGVVCDVRELAAVAKGAGALVAVDAISSLGAVPLETDEWELDAAFTPAVSLVRALEVALGLILDLGLEEAFDRHRRLGRACREGVKAMGLELFSPDDDSSAVVTAVRMPEGFDSTDLVRALRDRFGITIANGQGDLKGKIFRIGHIGYYDVFDVTTALAATEVALGDLGVAIEHGGAATRALEAYEDATRV